MLIGGTSFVESTKPKTTGGDTKKPKQKKMQTIKNANKPKPFEKIWTEEEEEILKSNYLEYTQRELQEKFFPNRTINQVLNKKMHLGLKKPPVWTNEQRGLLVDHGADYTHRELADKFFPDKTMLQVNYMRKYLGIKRRKKCKLN